jgi:hypothetical protein
MSERFATRHWPNCLVKLTPTLRLVPSSRFAPYGAAYRGRWASSRLGDDKRHTLA